MHKPWVWVTAVTALILIALPLRAQAPDRAPRASLGVRVEPTPPDAQRAGVIVREVTPDSPAAKAGLKAGDVIVKAENKAISDVDALSNDVAKHKPGDKITLQVLRDGTEQNLTVTLGERRSAGPGGPLGRGDRGRPGAGAFLGVQTQPLTPELKDRLGVGADQGALVTDVVPDSPAAKAGIKPEDVITGVDARTIGDPGQLRSAIQQAGVGKKVTVHAVRGKDKKDFTAELVQAPSGIPLNPPGGPPFPGDVIPPGFPRGILPDPQRVEQLERQVRDLENRVRELEKKLEQQPKK